jgi:hypothetical protein
MCLCVGFYLFSVTNVLPFYHSFLLTFAFLSMMVCLISLIYLYIYFCPGTHHYVCYFMSPCLCNCVLSVSLLAQFVYVFVKKSLGIDPFFDPLHCYKSKGYF